MSVLCCSNYPQPQSRGFTHEPGRSQQKNLYQEQMCSLLAGGQGLQGDPGSPRGAGVTQSLNGSIKWFLTVLSSLMSPDHLSAISSPSWCWLLVFSHQTNQHWHPEELTERSVRGSNSTSFSWTEQPGSLWQQGENESRVCSFLIRNTELRVRNQALLCSSRKIKPDTSTQRKNKIFFLFLMQRIKLVLMTQMSLC